MPSRRSYLVAAVSMLAATTGIAKTPKCTPRRKECRDPLSRCVQNELAVCTGNLGFAEAYGYAFGSVPVGLSYGLSCYSDSSPVEDCAEHLDAGTGWRIRTVSYQPPAYDVPYELESWMGEPCATGGSLGPGENFCTFGIPPDDVCITMEFQNPAAKGLPPHFISGNTCPTGPGGG
jgi:hypothetical protein